ncbi:MAG TPA: hypothetical protein VGL40_06350 [Bacillota bacterium]
MGWKRKAPLIYGGISTGLALLFVVLTRGPQYTAVARWGGAFWVLLLSLIITMPLVIPLVKGERIGGGHGH